MQPLYEENKSYVLNKFMTLVSIFPIATIGFANKVTTLHCLAYYVEDDLILVLVVRFTNRKYAIIANESVNKRFTMYKAKNPVEEIMLFDTAFRKLLEKIILDGVRQAIEKPEPNSLTDEKFTKFKNEGVLIC